MHRRRFARVGFGPKYLPDPPVYLTPMDIPITSRQAVREAVAREMLAKPEAGQSRAIEAVALRRNMHVDTVREIVEFVEEPQS